MVLYTIRGDIMARVLVSLSPEFLEEIDSLADAEHRSRSEFIREALRNYIRKNRQFNSAKASYNAALLDDLID